MLELPGFMGLSTIVASTDLAATVLAISERSWGKDERSASCVAR